VCSRSASARLHQARPQRSLPSQSPAARAQPRRSSLRLPTPDLCR
jgi:hypothetical protein